MIQDIHPHTYHNEFTPALIEKNALILSYDKKSVLIRQDGNSFTLPAASDFSGWKADNFIWLPSTTGSFSWPGVRCQLQKDMPMCLSAICGMRHHGTWHLLLSPACHWPDGTAIISYADAAGSRCSIAKKSGCCIAHPAVL